MSSPDDNTTEPATGQDEQEQSLMDHLIELRDRLLRMVLAILIVFIILFSFSSDIFTFVAKPLLALMPEGTSMIATGVTSPFLVPFKLVLLLSVLITIPYLLHQIWSFVAPGLYSHEKRMAGPLLISSVILFYCGITFAYFVIFPILFRFFIGIAPDGVAVMTDIGQYLDFIIAIFLAFGMAFEVPVATFLLVAAGITTPAKLADKRPYIIIAAFFFGMILTPPDVISQSLLAVPIWLLFELGLLMSRLFLKDKAEAEENVIMQTDDFELIEEAPAVQNRGNASDLPEDDHDAEGRPLNAEPDNRGPSDDRSGDDGSSDDEPDDTEPSDEDMDRMLDDAIHEEEENIRNADDGSDETDDEKDNKDKKDQDPDKDGKQ
jgi:sec-independent protein translocase protein TatC